MLIKLINISEKESFITGECNVDNYDLNDFKFLEVESNLKYEFNVSNVSENLIVKGNISLDVKLQCSRCIEFFSTTLRVYDFLRNLFLSKDQLEIDITNEIREELILNINSFSVCMDECKGICSGCGANLNKSFCHCVRNKNSDAWSILDELDL